MALIGIASRGSTHYVATVDPQTGLVGPIGIGFTASVTAGDVAAGGGEVYISSTNAVLTVVSDLTGQVVDSVSSPSTQLTYDDTDGLLYGFIDNYETVGLDHLTVVAPATGTQTNVGTAPGTGYSNPTWGFIAGTTASDGIAYAVYNTPNYDQFLLEVSETTGVSTSYQLTLTGSPVRYVVSIATDPSSGALLGLATLDTNDTSDVSLFSINPRTGGETVLGTTGVYSADVVTGTSSANAGIYNFVAEDAQGNEHVYSIDETTGAVLSDPVLTESISYLGASGVPCFCPGTMILTDRGEVAIECLAIGDAVRTSLGEDEPVRWIGRRSYSQRALRGRPDLLPILVRAGALGAGVPHRDLRVSPEHALLLDGLLIPARFLVNGQSVVREEVSAVTYLHVELMDQAIIMAEGAAVETFVDNDSRDMFENVDEFHRLYPDYFPSAVPAPHCESGYALEAVRCRLESYLRQPALLCD